MENKHIGSSFDDFLEEEGILEEVTSEAVNSVRAWEKISDDTELDILFGVIDDKLEVDDFGAVDLILSQVKVEDYPVVVAMGFLSTTWLVRDKLKYRERVWQLCYNDPRIADRREELYGNDRLR